MNRRLGKRNPGAGDARRGAVATPPRPRRRAPGPARTVAVALSLVAHAGMLAVLYTARPAAPPSPEPPPIFVSLVEPLPPPPPPPPPTPEEPSPPVETPAPPAAAKPAPAPAKEPAKAAAAPKEAPPKPRPPLKVRPARAKTPPPPDIAVLEIDAAPFVAPLPLVGEAELAGALTAGEGEGGGEGTGEGATGSGAGGAGGACNMVRRLQNALRSDPDIRAAVYEAHRAAKAGGKAIKVWNGDWIQSPGQEGKGLAGVRQAIMLEVAFAPKACRTAPVRGLVLLSMNDRAGAARVVLGTGVWRWQDLLSAG